VVPTSLTGKRSRAAEPNASPEHTPVQREHSLADADPAGPRPIDDQVTSWLGRIGEFKPDHDGFPQVVQADDYETIASVEALYSTLKTLSRDPNKWPSQDPPDPLRLRIDERAIVVSGADRSVSIEVEDGQASFAARSFRNPATVTLFRTLHTLSLALAKEFPPVGVLGTQFATRAYTRLTRIHFSFGPLVVQLEAAHNGARQPERLYILDLTRTRDSFLWAGNEER
jgi:hypothetical protein